MALSLAQIIPQALPPEPETGECEELSVKQRDPKPFPCAKQDSRLCFQGCCPDSWVMGSGSHRKAKTPSGATHGCLAQSLRITQGPSTFKRSQEQLPTMSTEHGGVNSSTHPQNIPKVPTKPGTAGADIIPTPQTHPALGKQE